VSLRAISGCRTEAGGCERRWSGLQALHQLIDEFVAAYCPARPLATPQRRDVA
jgi:hypothetical protein